MNRYSTGTGKVHPILVHNGWIAWVTSCHNKASSWKFPIPNQLQVRLALRSLSLSEVGSFAHLRRQPPLSTLRCNSKPPDKPRCVSLSRCYDWTPVRWDSYEIPATHMALETVTCGMETHWRPAFHRLERGKDMTSNDHCNESTVQI